MEADPACSVFPALLLLEQRADQRRHAVAKVTLLASLLEDHLHLDFVHVLADEVVATRERADLVGGDVIAWRGAHETVEEEVDAGLDHLQVDDYKGDQNKEMSMFGNHTQQ